MANGNVDLFRLRAGIQAQIERARTADVSDELRSDYAKYLCVCVSGFLEASICALLEAYSRAKCAPQVYSYVYSTLSYWTNPNCEKICELLGKFDERWASEMKSFLVDARKDSVNGLVGLRHKVAHGESVGVTIDRVSKYYVTIDEVVGKIEGVVGLSG